MKAILSSIICVKEYSKLQYIITNIIIRYLEVIIEKIITNITIKKNVL
jgi:hypothetical protein